MLCKYKNTILKIFYIKIVFLAIDVLSSLSIDDCEAKSCKSQILLEIYF